MMINRCLGVLAVLAALSMSAHAQQGYTVEEIARVRDFEIARYVPASLTERNGERMFDVFIRYADPDEVPPGGIASRKVSYRARCEAGEMAISVIVVRNIRGQMLKAVTVPPGGEEFFRPDPSSTESDWLYRACG